MSRLIFLFALVLAACTDAGPGCPDPDNPQGAALQCHMVGFLDDAGLGHEAVTDAHILQGEAGRAMLAARPGWAPEEQPGFYELGEAVLYANGQRVIYRDDGRIELLTFARTDNAAFLGNITLDAEGGVAANVTSRIPL